MPTMLTLPPGYSQRPARLEDAEAVLAILHATSMAAAGEISDSLDEVLETWGAPGFDLSRNSCLILNPAGRIDGYVVIEDDVRPFAPAIDVYSHPDHWPDDFITPLLLDWCQARTLENIPIIPADSRLVMHAFCYSTEERYQAQLRAAGFETARHFYRMKIDLTEAPALPVWPAGVRLHTVAAGEDWHGIYDVRRDAWRDHWGYVERDYATEYAEWSYQWGHDYTPGLWFAALEGDEVIGICLCKPKRAEDETMGWVQTLGVRRAARGRGVAMALLRHAFTVFQAMGKEAVGLGVDASSPTGATRLYERAGMSIQVRFDLLEKELRPGQDYYQTGD
jgi:ribosomal protein S18 acetylase RimI-like enzyme